jgi:predicted GNAT family acetyltransferase
MFHVKTMEPNDFSFAVSLANTMNWNMTSADFEFNRKLEPNGCFVLLEDSQPVGLATCISYKQIGWFGNLVVKDIYRKHGAGTHLVQHAVKYLKNAGATTIGLYAYPHLADFYGKIGFKCDSDFLVLKTDAVSSLPASSGILRQADARDLPTIVNFDEVCFGASRRKLLGEILKNPDNLAYIAIEGSEAFGFGAAKVYNETAEIGPLACKIGKPQAATALLRVILSKLEGFEAYMYLPATETALLDVAFRADFKEEFRLNRMFFGPAVSKTCIYLTESLERG